MQISLNKKEIELLLSVMDGSYLNRDCEDIIRLKNRLNRLLVPIKISSRKSKGRNLQKWICNKISKLIGIEYNQQNDQCSIHSREMGQPGCDIILRGEALKKFPFSVECKSSESFNITKAVQQAIMNQYKDTDWLIFYKRKLFNLPIVIMDYSTFERLYKNEWFNR